MKKNKYKIFLVGIVFVIVTFIITLVNSNINFFSRQIPSIPDGIQRILFTDAELHEMKIKFLTKRELWRADAVEVVKKDHQRIGITVDEAVEVREHGEYRYGADGKRRTLIMLVRHAGRLQSESQAVLVEEQQEGYWIPKEVGPFYKMIQRY